MEDVIITQTKNNKNKIQKNQKKKNDEMEVVRADVIEDVAAGLELHSGDCIASSASPVPIGAMEGGASQSLLISDGLSEEEQGEVVIVEAAMHYEASPRVSEYGTADFSHKMAIASQVVPVTPVDGPNWTNEGNINGVSPDVPCTPQSFVPKTIVVNLGPNDEANRSLLKECLPSNRGSIGLPTKRKCDSLVSQDEVTVISSDDDILRPPAAKKVTEFGRGRTSIDDVLNRLLARLLKIDEIREKSRMQGGSSGKIKGLLIDTIEDLHLMSTVLTEEQRKDFKAGLKHSALRPNDKSTEILKNENSALRKRLVKIQMEKEALTKTSNDMAMQIASLEGKILELGKQQRKVKAKPKIIEDRLITVPVALGNNNPADTSSKNKQLDATDVERIVMNVMTRIGIVAANNDEVPPGTVSCGDVIGVEGMPRKSPSVTWEQGVATQLSTSDWPKIGDGLPTGKKGKKKKKPSMAAAEVQKQAAERTLQPNRGIIREVPASTWEPPGTAWNKRPAKRTRKEDTVVITVNRVRSGSDKDEEDKAKCSYKQALTEMRAAANLKELGILETDTRRGRNGGFIIELPGVTDARHKAMELVKKVQGRMPEGIRVACPQRKADIVLHGLDPSITVEEAVGGVAEACECLPEDITPSDITEIDSDLGRMWMSCPVAVARRAAALRTVKLGWSTVRIAMARPRLAQCFKCLDFGHIRAECTSPFDRSTNCHKCGRSGHKIGECDSLVAKCALCPPGCNAHKTGSAGCAALQEAIIKNKRVRDKQRQGRGPPTAKNGGLTKENQNRKKQSA